MATFAYLRYSTDSQDEKSQLNIIHDYLSNKGMHIDRTFTDEGIGGGMVYTKRNLFDLCKEIKHGDTIVISEISRLTRRGIGELSSIIEQHFKPNNLRLIICNVGLDIDCTDINPMIELQLAMMATFAKIEKQLIVDRTKSKLEAIKKEIATTGQHVAKSGRVITKLGRQDDGAGTAWDKALTNSIETRKRKAEANENNIKFAKWLAVYESRNGAVDRKTDLEPLVSEVNDLGLKTSSGMSFNKASLRAMIYRTHERSLQKLIV